MEEIHSIQKHPKFWLANYFSDLKRDVDLEYQPKLSEKKGAYIQIINEIEKFETDLYSKAKPFKITEFQSNEQIDPIELDLIKYKCEENSFSNKTIMFTKWYEYFNYDSFEKFEIKLLLIINDEYLRKSTWDDYAKPTGHFNREKLITNHLKQQLNEKHKKYILKCVIYLDIKLYKQTLISKMSANIKSIDPLTLHDLYNLLEIDLRSNQIQELPSKLFNGLINLKKLHFENNQIKELDKNLFNGLVNLNEINYDNNKITELPCNLFNGLLKLEKIYFRENEIRELDEGLFNDLKCLHEINFNRNHIEELNENLFKRIISLRSIHFCCNSIK